MKRRYFLTALIYVCSLPTFLKLGNNTTKYIKNGWILKAEDL